MKHSLVKNVFALIIAIGIFATAKMAAADETAKSAPTPKRTVTIDGVEFDLVEQAPQLMVAPLQVFGAFEYQKKNDGFSGSDIEMDEGFKGLIQDLRKNDHFGQLAENIVLTPPQGGTVVPQKVLLMGLGDPKKFSSQDMKKIGQTEVRVACQMGLDNFSHASDVQDGGVHAPPGAIAENVVEGIIAELRTQKQLADKGAVAPCNIKKVALLVGPKYLQDTEASFEKLAKRLNTTTK